VVNFSIVIVTYGRTMSAAIAGFSLLPKTSVITAKTRGFWRREKAVYEAIKERNPERWSGEARDWNLVTEVWLNSPKEMRTEEQKLRKAA
jgi:hypothetical protein